MERGQRVDRGTVRDRDHLPVVRPVPHLVRADRLRCPDRLGSDSVVGPVVSGRRGLGVGKSSAVRKGRDRERSAWGVEGK